jgi:serine/threonine protein phosphatase PrpC
MSGAIPLRCSTVSLRGRKCEGWPKPANQDAYTLNSSAEFPIFGVFDGHGSVGHAVSDYVRDEIAKRMPSLLHQLAEVPKDSLPEKARRGCEKLFRKIESRLREQSMKWENHIDTAFSGTTAVVVALLGTTLICAWCGDSRAVLGSLDAEGKMRAIDLSNDHVPNRPDEQLRIEASGGMVRASASSELGPGGTAPTLRVYENRPKGEALRGPGLAMSRSFGDDTAHSLGVIAKPEVTVRELTEMDRFLVVASDGVFGVLSSSKVVNIVHKAQRNVKQACKQVVRRSAIRWREECFEGYRDDITVQIIDLWAERKTGQQADADDRRLSGDLTVEVDEAGNDDQRRRSSVLDLEDDKDDRRDSATDDRRDSEDSIYRPRPKIEMTHLANEGYMAPRVMNKIRRNSVLDQTVTGSSSADILVNDGYGPAPTPSRSHASQPTPEGALQEALPAPPKPLERSSSIRFGEDKIKKIPNRFADREPEPRMEIPSASQGYDAQEALRNTLAERLHDPIYARLYKHRFGGAAPE